MDLTSAHVCRCDHDKIWLRMIVGRCHILYYANIHVIDFTKMRVSLFIQMVAD